MSARPRVAYVSPLPPQTSGIADYSAELLPALAEHLDLELAVDDGVEPAGSLGALPRRRSRELGAVIAAGRYEAALYQLGNNPDFHAAAYRALLAQPRATPAVVVLHEVVLHHLVRDMALRAGEPDAYVEALRWCYGRTGEALGRRAVGSGVPLDPFRYPLFERAVDASAAVIVPNLTIRDRVLRSRPQARVAVVPHAVSFQGLEPPSPAGAREALGIATDDFVVSTFGFLTEAKRVPVLLRAFARLRAELPAARRARTRLVLAGEVSPHYHFDFAGSGLMDGVEITGRLELDRFVLHLAACDVAVNLRHPTAGETSGVLVRLLGLGKPVVVTRAGAFAEIPDGCCAKVPVGEDEEELLLAVLRALADDPELRRAMGEAGRRHVAGRTPAAAAAAYADVVRRAVDERWTAPLSPPPLAPYPPHDLLAELVRRTAADLVDLGAADDGEALTPIAAAMVGLGLDQVALRGRGARCAAAASAAGRSSSRSRSAGSATGPTGTGRDRTRWRRRRRSSSIRRRLSRRASGSHTRTRTSAPSAVQSRAPTRSWPQPRASPASPSRGSPSSARSACRRRVSSSSPRAATARPWTPRCASTR
jgi:glycosyltransferase involved in cell wall biosynthesis